ncbi:2-amino-4-hydroxy-6-hydroxymethyldihydropteridine diphosphokinase [Neptunomonas qingdaonensis]|uniref:2-amino-4-hydroxy-6-hydroxymethyldihydropteridine diphosphokinase n=1 Tax=Neptunomonas qingdaonensis TaxID=1045558 RepID=A0A1I2N249_9GAMM|nr:2-amino-4-hydroxy-6-hydroxymethyldihydropteridine diphosphokinase [Neptunomonas qingdaonensis]SFF95606.1 2-amino-4-hydroxy-6-hydroxymethyldihydropteridinediphosphokinase [Neptunomonas qingdaonensis]
MPCVYLSIGSNIERYKHVTAGLDRLNTCFSPLVISSVYESESVGFNGNPFLNLVVGLETDLEIGALSALLKGIEDDNGRVRGGPKFAPRTLDVDILTCGDQVGCFAGVQIPRNEILTNAFVLWPLAEVAPLDMHPVVGKNYQTLWREYDKSTQKLRPVNFNWQGRLISQGA